MLERNTGQLLFVYQFAIVTIYTKHREGSEQHLRIGSIVNKDIETNTCASHCEWQSKDLNKMPTDRLSFVSGHINCGTCKFATSMQHIMYIRFQILHIELLLGSTAGLAYNFLLSAFDTARKQVKLLTCNQERILRASSKLHCTSIHGT